MINTGLANCCQSRDVRWIGGSDNNVFMIGLTCSRLLLKEAQDQDV